MKFGKSRLIFTTSFLLVCSLKICAQTPVALSGQPSKSSPFIQGKTVINEIKIDGADADGEYYDPAIYGNPIHESEGLSLLRLRGVNLSAGQKFDAEKVGKAIVALKKWLADLSYWEADVTAIGETFPDYRMNLIFSIKRHSVNRISEIRFTGNENLTGEELNGVMRDCLGKSWGILNKPHL